MPHTEGRHWTRAVLSDLSKQRTQVPVAITLPSLANSGSLGAILLTWIFPQCELAALTKSAGNVTAHALRMRTENRFFVTRKGSILW